MERQPQQSHGTELKQSQLNNRAEPRPKPPPKPLPQPLPQQKQPSQTTSQEQPQPTKQKKRSAVQRDEIIAHLRILAVFHKLKLDVQARAPHNPTGLWTAFLSYAVEKFSAWIANVIEKEGENGKDDGQLSDEDFPTIDVAMVWHAYILNPLEYYKDCQKHPRGLLRIKSYPIIRLAEVIDTLGLEPRHPVPAFGSANTHPSGSLSSKRSIPLGPQFSLDLVAAVKRQASFIAQVAAVGWTQPRPKGIEAVVASSIDKYHGFLKKLWENPEALAVPTLEIDLAWHTHQLNVDVYRQDSMMLFGRILQHDDDIPSPELNKAFQRHSFDWQNMFHMDYSGGSVCTGFRPVAVTSPGPFTPRPSTSPSRPSSRDSSRTSSEVSLQEFYRLASEKRPYDGSTTSFSTPSSNERDSPQSSSAASLPGSSNTSLQSSLIDHNSNAKDPEGSLGTPSSKNGTIVKPQMQMLRPNNDSMTTILGRPFSGGNGARPPSSGNGAKPPSSGNGARPPSSGYGARPPNSGANSLPHSRKSSFSDNGSAIFAYSPPPSRGLNDTRGAFDKPPATRLRPSSATSTTSSPTLRPTSAGSSATPTAQRPNYKLIQHHVSSSTGKLYTPGVSSSLPRSPIPLQGSPGSQNLDWETSTQISGSSQRLPKSPSLTTMRQMSAQNDAASIKDTIREPTHSPSSSAVNVGLHKSPSGSHINLSYPPSAWKRPSSSGNPTTSSPLAQGVTLPQRPSTSAGPTSKSSMSSAPSVSSRPTTPKKSISVGGSLNLFRRSSSSAPNLNKAPSDSNLLQSKQMLTSEHSLPSSRSLSSRFVEMQGTPPSTALGKTSEVPNRGLERSRSSKKPKSEKNKRPWYRFW